MMNLEQLKDYLRGAIDLESAIQAAEHAIAILDGQIQRIQSYQSVIPKPQYPYAPQLHLPADEPVEPQLTPYRLRDVAFLPLAGNFIFTIACTLGGFFGCLRWGVPHALAGAALGLFVLAPAMAYPYYLRLNREAQQRYNSDKGKYNHEMQRRKETREEYEASVAAWNGKCTRISETHNMLLASQRLIEQQKQQQCDHLGRQRSAIVHRLDQLRARLQQYYSNGPIYESYRNLVAVTQIYEYLASGISRRLDGPNGAYAQYMNDVRTARICGSLEHIRMDMNRGFSRVLANQQMLCGELQSINRTLDDLSASCENMHSSLASASSQLTSLADSANRLQQDVSGSITQLHTQLTGISRDTHTAALNTAMVGLNQYLDMKSRGADAYHVAYYP